MQLLIMGKTMFGLRVAAAFGVCGSAIYYQDFWTAVGILIIGVVLDSWLVDIYKGTKFF